MSSSGAVSLYVGVPIEVFNEHLDVKRDYTTRTKYDEETGTPREERYLHRVCVTLCSIEIFERVAASPKEPLLEEHYNHEGLALEKLVAFLEGCREEDDICIVRGARAHRETHVAVEIAEMRRILETPECMTTITPAQVEEATQELLDFFDHLVGIALKRDAVVLLLHTSVS